MKARLVFFAGIAAIGLSSQARADVTSPLPGPAFAGDRYAGLWNQSPFAIATPDAPASSEDYELVGTAQFGGISYVSLIDKQDQYHFVLTSDKPFTDPEHKLNLKLVSITHGHDGSSAVVLRNGEPLTLRQDAAVQAPSLSSSNGVTLSQQGMIPSPNPAVGGFVPANTLPPAVRFHRRLIHIPPPPN
jgi:hypothetical protein